MDLTTEELDTAVKKTGLGKSPSQDGLTTNFYHFVWTDIRELLFEALKDCLQKNVIDNSEARYNNFNTKTKQR